MCLLLVVPSQHFLPWFHHRRVALLQPFPLPDMLGASERRKALLLGLIGATVSWPLLQKHCRNIGEVGSVETWHFDRLWKDLKQNLELLYTFITYGPIWHISQQRSHCRLHHHSAGLVGLAQRGGISFVCEAFGGVPRCHWRQFTKVDIHLDPTWPNSCADMQRQHMGVSENRVYSQWNSHLKTG